MTKRTVFGTNFKAIITFLVETSRRRTTACRHLGTTTFAVYQAKSQGVYLNLLTSGKLNGYLTDLDKQAEDMFFRLVKQMAEREDVTEKLKADDQMEWVDRMNNIRSRAKEVINNELIFS